IVGDQIYADKPDEWAITAATQLGQKVEPRLFGDMFEELRTLDEPGSLLIPEGYRAYVQIDPRIMGGSPVVRNTRISTSVLATLREKGKSLTELARLYKPVSRQLIAKALEYEAFLNQPITEV